MVGWAVWYALEKQGKQKDSERDRYGLCECNQNSSIQAQNVHFYAVELSRVAPYYKREQTK
jgi:hypothetical protein